MASLLATRSPYQFPAIDKEARRQAMCAGKQSFANGTLAHRHLARLRKGDRSGGSKLQAYRCSMCGQFHLGTVESAVGKK